MRGPLSDYDPKNYGGNIGERFETDDIGLRWMRATLAYWMDHYMLNEFTDDARNLTRKLARAAEVVHMFCDGALPKMSYIPMHRRTEFLRYLEVKFNVKLGDF